jgi:cell division septum initiation protein DivIVA
VGAKIATAEKAVDDVKKDATKTAEDIATIVDPLEKDVAGLKKTADPIITEARKVIAEAKASPDPEVQKLAVEEEKKIDKMLASVGMGGTNPLIILVGVGLAIMSYMSATKGKK